MLRLSSKAKEAAMKALIVADSVYGNTRKVAEAIAGALDGARVLEPADVDYGELRGLDLLLVGAPTQAGRPTPAIKAFLDNVPPGALENVRVGVFDTRIDVSTKGPVLRFLLGTVGGFAAPKIARKLHAKGGQLVAPPEGFIVEGKEGPLREGELARAAKWANALVPSRT
jgi:flavodoxin I